MGTQTESDNEKMCSWEASACDRRGAATLEMAFVLPIIFLFMFAAFEFTRFSMMRPTIDSAVYDATRRAIVPGATQEAVESEARKMLSMVGIHNADIQISELGVDVPTTTITITASVGGNTLFPLKFLRNTIIRRTMTMNREGVK